MSLREEKGQQVLDIVLAKRHFDNLKEREDFNSWYRNLLFYNTLIFIGFGGNDPNFIWHCQTLHDFFGPLQKRSYFLRSASSAPDIAITNAGIIDVPYSPNNNHEALHEILNELHGIFNSKIRMDLPPQRVEAKHAEESKNVMALTVSSLATGEFHSAYRSAISAMVMDAAYQVKPDIDRDSIIKALQQKYLFSISDAEIVLDESGVNLEEDLVSLYESRRNKHEKLVSVLKKGLIDRIRAYNKSFSKDANTINIIFQKIIEDALSQHGYAIALAISNGDSPDSALVSTVVRESIQHLSQSIQAFGEIDKEILASAAADLFQRPSLKEAPILSRIAQAAVGLGFAFIFPTREQVLGDIIPSEVYLDSNVLMPIILKDHRNHEIYVEMLNDFGGTPTTVRILAGFLNELESHYKLSFEEINHAKITSLQLAKDYAEFEGELYINTFIAAYAKGGKRNEGYRDYIKRVFKIGGSGRVDFTKITEAAGIEVVRPKVPMDTDRAKLTFEIAEAKKAQDRLKHQILAEHEAEQIYWMHLERRDVHPWFISEDRTLRRILRQLRSDEYGLLGGRNLADGILPVDGVLLLISAFKRGKMLSSQLSRLIWNPSLEDFVDSALTAAIKKTPFGYEELRKLPLTELREQCRKIFEERASKQPKDMLRIRAKEFREGHSEIVDSIYRNLGQIKN